MKLNDHYDWIVLGSQSGRSFKRKFGRAFRTLRILFFPSHRRGCVFRSPASGQYFDPESNYLIGLGNERKDRGLIFRVSQLNSEYSPPKKRLIDTHNCVPQV